MSIHRISILIQKAAILNAMQACVFILLACVLTQIHRVQTDLTATLNQLLQTRKQIAESGGESKTLEKVCDRFRAIEAAHGPECLVVIRHHKEWVNACSNLIDANYHQRTRWWKIHCDISFLPRFFSDGAGKRRLEIKFKS